MPDQTADPHTMNLKIRVGVHEFEASGPVDVVQAQWAAFRDLVERRDGINTPGNAHITAHQDDVNAHEVEMGVVMNRIMKRIGRVVSLAVSAASLNDEILLLLLGQQMLRANHLVMGGELLQGLRQAGRPVGRVDYQLNTLREAGHVVTAGVRRARRYRLSDSGIEKAEHLARTVMDTAAPRS